MVDISTSFKSSRTKPKKRASRHARNQVQVIESLADEVSNLDRSTLSHRMRQVVKRLIDVVFAVAGLIALSPLLALVALAIRLDSAGPAFFRQTRWGLNGRKITVFKFRSMHVGSSDKAGTKQTVANDERTTRLGVFLRKTSIDELPQLLNIIAGDMSLVGPRCHPVGMKAGGKLYEDLIPQYHLRHTVRPGLTGLAQVRGFRGPTLDVDLAQGRLRSDLEYIAHQSIWQDIVIIVKTVVTELRGGSGF